MKFSNQFVVKAVLLATLIGSAPMIQAQTYPNKPVRFIVAFTAGSGTDVIARAIGDVMSSNLGHPLLLKIDLVQVARSPHPK